MEAEKDKKFLTPEELMKRWQIEDQHPKILYRLRTSRSKKTKLKSTKIGNQIRYRIEDVEDWEQRNTKNSVLLLSQVSSDEKLSEWLRLAQLAEFDK